MRIAVCVNTLSAGGAESFCVAIAKEYKKAGHYVMVLIDAILDIKGHRLEQELKETKIPLINLNITKNRDKIILPYLYSKVFREHHIDVVHSNLEQSDTYVALSKLFYHKPLMVRTLHSKLPFSTYPHFIHKLLFGLYKVNFGCGEDMKNEYLYEDLREKIYPINNGIEVKTISDEERNFIRNKIREELNLDDDVIIGIQVGTMSPRFGGILTKGHDMTFEALSKISNNNLRLLVVGDCTSRNDSELYNQNYVHDERIIYYGISSNVNDLIIASDFALAPSRTEGLPITGMEYACLGLPIVCSSIKQFQVIYSDSVLVFENGNTEDFVTKLNLILNNISKYKQLAIAQQDNAQEIFSMKKCCLKYLDKINTLIKSCD